MNSITKREAHRQTHINESDKRVQKTKVLLRNCLIELLDKKSINQITVSELTAKANVNRSTFYFYYKDVYDMMEKIQEETYNTFEREIVSTDLKFDRLSDYMLYITKFLDFCKENNEVCKFVIMNDCNNNLANKIREAVVRNIPNSTSAYDIADSRYYLTTFALSAFLGTILRWIQEGMQVPTKDMAEFLSTTYVLGALQVKERNFLKLD